MKKTGMLIVLAGSVVQALYGVDPPGPTDNPQPTGSVPGSIAAVSSNEGPLSRWLDLKTLSFSMRYRNAADSDGFHLYDFGQQRGLIEGALKLDAAGKYSIHFRVSSGRDFTRSYTDEIGGTFADTSPRAVAFFPSDQADQFAQTVALDAKALSTLHEFAITRGWKCLRGSSI
jgi:hypothetical protein